MSDPRHDRLAQWPLHRALGWRTVAWREQYAMTDREGGKRNVHRELRFQAVPDPAAGGTHHRVRVLGPEALLLRGRGLGAACRSEEHTSELQSLRHLVCR